MVFMMAMLWAQQIMLGRKTFADVPRLLKDKMCIRDRPEDVLRSHLRREFPQAQEEDITAAIDRSGGFLGQARCV